MKTDIDRSAFEQIERELDLFDLKIQDVPIWERIRVDLFKDLREKSGLNQSRPKPKKNFVTGIKAGKLWMKNLFHKSPFQAPSAEIMFVGHPRRQLESNQTWWDIYCDPIHNQCNYDYVHFEHSYYFSHKTPAQTENLYYLDLIGVPGIIASQIHFPSVPLDKNHRHLLEETRTRIYQMYDIDVDVISYVKEELCERKTTYKLYKKLLKKINPQVVIIIVSYGRQMETLIEVCKSENIPVVELQHGIIDSDHLGYSYPEDINKHTFPDYVFTFGDFWGDNINYPIKKERVISIGYPYLEQKLEELEINTKKHQIVFISQGPVGKELSKFAVDVSEKLDDKYQIIYKLHPNEYDWWQKSYPWLKRSQMTVIDDSNRSLYSLFTESGIQVGVYSTAIYEGINFGLDTYIIDLPGSDRLDPLIETGIAKKIATPEEFIKQCRQSNNGRSFDKEYFFKSDPISNFKRELNHIVQ